jgi:hypothetical protein
LVLSQNTAPARDAAALEEAQDAPARARRAARRLLAWVQARAFVRTHNLILDINGETHAVSSSTAVTVRCAGFKDCTCAIVSKPAPVRDSGTCTISGGQIFTNSSVKGFVIGTTFCVSGNELALQSDSIDLGDFTVPGTMILSMQ